MAVAVVVPWRPGDAHREAAWQWVRNRYATQHPSWEVVEGHHLDGPWCKALAVHNALTKTTADTLIVADADVWVDNLPETLEHVHPGSWAVPHHGVYRLDEPSTASVLAGGPLDGTFTQRPYKGHLGGGIVCIHRADYEQAPLDPRFHGWGQEDDSWAIALTVMFGKPWRGKAPLWHLYHPPQPRLSRVTGSREGSQLFARYRQARNPRVMAALLEEVTRGPHQAEPGGLPGAPQLSEGRR